MQQRETTIERQRWLVEQLNDCPWAGAKDLAALGPFTVSQVRKSLADLERQGLVKGITMGATRPRQTRYVLTGDGVQRFREISGLEPSWYTCEVGVRDLAGRLPMVEQVYEVLPKLLGPGRFLAIPGLREGYVPRLTGFTWLRQGSWHAIVEFEGNLWFVITWVGLWSTVKTLRDKWRDRLRGGMYQSQWDFFSGAYVERDAMPSAWVIVAQDLWAAQLGIEEVAPDAHDDEKLVFVNGEDISVSFGVAPSRDSVTETTHVRNTGEPGRAVDRLSRNPKFAAINGKGRHGIFNVVSEYHGATAAQVRRYLNDATDERVGDVLREQVEAGLVARFGRNHYLAKGGWDRAGAIDRRSSDTIGNMLKAFVKPEDSTRTRYRKHDSLVLEIAIRLKRHGYACANGWRANLDVQGMRTVKPDLMVLVGDGPFRHGWYFLEMERSAATPQAVEHKLRTYLNFKQKGLDLPFIVVTETRRAALFFQEYGRLLGLDIMTALYSEVMSEPLAGPATAFRHLGEPALLYPAGDDPNRLLLWPEIRPRHKWVGRWAPDRKKDRHTR